jgi:thioredoxin-like negative regulator of GroEL
MTAMRQWKWNEAIVCLYDSIRAPNRFYSNEDAMLKLAACLCNAGRQDEAAKWLEQLTRSKRTDIRGKAIQSLDALKRNPRTVLFLD